MLLYIRQNRLITLHIVEVVSLDITNKKTILIVDDTELNREMLSLILQENYNTIEAGNGLEAIEMLEKNINAVSLILLDIVMPVMNGFKFLEKVQEDKRLKSIPIIFITAETYRENILKAIEMGVRDIIAKPFDSQLVCNRVNNLILLAEKRQKNDTKQTIDLKKDIQIKNKKPTALVVEDAEINRLIIKGCIEDDYDIIEAANGQIGVHLLEKHNDTIDVVLLDIIMPIMDGIEMMEEVNKKKLAERIPVIAITTEDSLPKINKIKELGICEVIHKPFNPSVVKNRIDYLLELYHSKAY